MGRQDREQTAHVVARNALADRLVDRLPPGTPACVRPRSSTHRESDWRRPAGRSVEGGPWVCGICHPPAAGWTVERRGG